MTLKSPRQQQFLKTKLSNGCFKFGEDVETEEELEEKAQDVETEEEREEKAQDVETEEELEEKAQDVETEEELEEKARGKAYLSLVAKMGPRGDA